MWGRRQARPGHPPVPVFPSMHPGNPRLAPPSLAVLAPASQMAGTLHRPHCRVEESKSDDPERLGQHVKLSVAISHSSRSVEEKLDDSQEPPVPSRHLDAICN